MDGDEGGSVSERIEVGDLVIVVKAAPCGCENALGKIFKVDEIRNWHGACTHCWKHHPEIACAKIQGDSKWVDCYRLKKIPPLTEPDGIEKREELTA